MSGNSLAMMPWFPRDFLAATRAMRLAERGAYCDLLFYQWEMGMLPNAPEALLRLLGCSLQEFKQVWPALAPKFVVENGHMYNVRLEEHRSKTKQINSDKSLAGKLGGLKSGEARRSKREAEHQAERKHSANGSAASKSEPPSPSPSPSKNPTPTPPKGGAVRQRRSGKRAERDAALRVWQELIASDGASPPRDEKLQAAIDAAGGWSRIAQRERGIEDSIVRKAFCDAYRALGGAP